MNIHRVKLLVFLFPVILFLFFLCLKLIFADVYTSLIQEDSVIENMQAVLYLASSIMAFFVSIKCLRSRMTLHGVLYSALAIGLLFVSIEEISWGQRIFSIPNPAYFEQHNAQKEISLHNIRVLQHKLHGAYILVGAYGAFAWIILSRLFAKWKNNFRHIANFVVPDWFISSYFFFTFLLYTLYKYIFHPHSGGFPQWRDQETVELLLSLGFLFFVITNYIRLRLYLSESSSGRAKSARRRYYY